MNYLLSLSEEGWCHMFLVVTAQPELQGGQQQDTGAGLQGSFVTLETWQLAGQIGVITLHSKPDGVSARRNICHILLLKLYHTADRMNVRAGFPARSR